MTMKNRGALVSVTTMQAVPIRGQFSPLILIVMLLASTVSILQITTVSGVTWTTPTAIPADPAFHFNPSVTQELGPQGKIWLVWQRVTVTSNVDIYSKKFISTWTADEPLLATPDEEISPDITTLNNGTLMLVWARKPANGNFQLYYMLNNQGTWSGQKQLTFTSSDDTVPSLIQARDGRIWVTWERKAGSMTEIYYKIFDGTRWLDDTPLTAATGADRFPSIAQAKGGKIWIVWATTRGGNFDLIAKVFDGVSWSPDRFITTNNQDDMDPEIFLDREGTLWVFWTRLLNAPGGSFQSDLTHVSSVDHGATFSGETDFSNTPNIDERNAALGMFSDGRIWLLWSNQGEFASQIDLYLSKSNQILVHDLAITRVTSSPPFTDLGMPATSNITVTNLGDFPENAQVNLYANNTLIDTRTVSLDIGASALLTFNWDTSKAGGGRFVIRGVVAAAPGETVPNQVDNSLNDGMIRIKPPGDVNGDLKIDILDAALVADAFDTMPGMPKWNQAADINKDGIVNILDMSIVAFYFGTVF